MFFTDAFICVSKSSEKDFFEREPEIYTKKLLKRGRKHFTIYNCTNTDVKTEKTEKINHYKQIVKSLYLTNIAIQNYNLTQKEKKRKRR